MDIKTIKKLTEIFEESGLTYMNVEEGDFRICLKKESSAPSNKPAAKTPAPHPAEEIVISRTAEEPSGKSFSNIHEVKAPLAGVFYAAATPDSPAFVSVGDRVKKGDVLCIIEAMKQMNEITCDRDGEIADICGQNEQIVEYGQTLFKIF